ncbi:hypothetical protein [Halovenus halobia]|uniref:hypothetical protein n=1 Tax=Halovenus halobia TaxID=3396622 RepID=UPI003F562514
MPSDDSETSGLSATRRTILATVGTTGLAALAGCQRFDSDSSFTPPSFETTAGSLYGTWLPEEKQARHSFNLSAVSPAMSLRAEPQSVVTERLNILKTGEIRCGVDLSSADHVIRVNYGSRIATGSLDTDSLKQTLVEQMPYERTSSYGDFTIYSRTDDREQKVALGLETAISSTVHERQRRTIESIIDTKFGTQLNALQTDDALKAVADGLGHTYHGTTFTEPSDGSYDSESLPDKMAQVRRLTDEYGYLIHQAAFPEQTSQTEIEEFAAELDNNWDNPELETTYTTDSVSARPSLRHYVRVSREDAIESVDVTPLPDIAFSVEESPDTLTLTHEYGDTVDARNLKLEGYLTETEDSVPFDTQPRDTYSTFDQGSSLQVSTRLAGESVRSINLSYTKMNSPFNLLLHYSLNR